VFPAARTEPNIVVDMEHNLVEYLQECEGGANTSFCEQEPCVWLANHDSILAWDTSQHGILAVEWQSQSREVRLEKMSALSIPQDAW
jgi:hypothetical protein